MVEHSFVCRVQSGICYFYTIIAVSVTFTVDVIRLEYIIYE